MVNSTKMGQNPLKPKRTGHFGPGKVLMGRGGDFHPLCKILSRKPRRLETWRAYSIYYVPQNMLISKLNDCK